MSTQFTKSNFSSFTRLTVIAAVIASSLALTACDTRSSSGAVYNRNQAQREQTVRMATVESVRNVTIEGNRSGLGAGAGAVVGGVAGAGVGGGRGSIIAATLGAVAGGLVGNAIEGGVSRDSAVEITVRFENGTLSAITQADDEGFRPGDRVRVLSGNGATRVTR